MRAGGVGVDGWMRRLIQMKQKEEELVQKSRSRNSSQASDFSDLQTQLQQAAPLVLGAAPGLLRTQRPDKARGQDDDKNVTNATLPVAALELDGGLESFVEAAHAKYGQPAPKEGGANGLGGPNGGGSVFSGSDDHGFGSSSRSHSNPGVKGRRRPSVGSEGAGSRGHHRHPSSESGGQGGYDYGDFGGVSVNRYPAIPLSLLQLYHRNRIHHLSVLMYSNQLPHRAMMASVSSTVAAPEWRDCRQAPHSVVEKLRVISH